MLKVYCPWCKKHIYNLKTKPQFGDYINAENFIPINNNIKQPINNVDEILCPYCQNNFLRENNMYGAEILTNEGWLP